MKELYAILKKVEDEDFENSKDFIEDGLLDSLDIMTLVEELEEEYNITISGKNILPENFTNIDAIANLVIISGGKM